MFNNRVRRHRFIRYPPLFRANFNAAYNLSDYVTFDPNRRWFWARPDDARSLEQSHHLRRSAIRATIRVKRDALRIRIMTMRKQAHDVETVSPFCRV